MAEHPIQNCGWRFEFKCPKRWDALHETSEAGVRACDHCQKRVYLCRSEPEVFRHAREGHCIAVPAKVRVAGPVPKDPDVTSAKALAARHGVPFIYLEDFALDLDVLRRVPREVAARHQLIPAFMKDSTLVVAMSDPSLVQAIDEVRSLSGHEVEVRVASRTAIRRVLLEWVEDGALCDLGLVIGEPEPLTRIERLLHYVLTNAYREGAEQIRIEATDSRLVVRHLVAGVSHDILSPPVALREELLREFREAADVSAEAQGVGGYYLHKYFAHWQLHEQLGEQSVELVLVMTTRAHVGPG